MASAIVGGFAAIASAATGAALAVTGSAALAAGIGNAIIGAGAFLASWKGALLAANIAASILLAPDVNREGSPTEWRPDPNAGFPVAIGRVATAGSIIHMDEHGPDNRYLTIANLLSVGPIDAIESFKADRVAVTFSGTGATAPADYADKMWLSTSTGASATALSVGALPHGAASLAGWNAQSTLPGLAHTLWTLYQDSKFKSYPQGAPDPLHILRGVKVYDPRKDSTYPGGSGSHRLDDPDTWEFSKNPGLHAIAWALGHAVTDPNTSKVYRVGIGCSASGINWPAFVELANVCDANDWEVSAVPTSLDDPHQVLKAILQAGGARYASLAGKISCIARTPRTSTVTVSAADTAGPFEIEVNADRLTKRNTITPRCVQEDHDWQMTPQDSVSVAEYVTADGGELAQSLDYPYVAVAPASANKDQPRQLAAYAMLDSRESIVGTVPFRPHMAQVEPGDVFTVTEPGFLLDGVELLCLQRTIDAANNTVQLTFVSESAGKHDFALGRTNTPPTPPGLTAPDIRDVPAPEAAIFTATAGTGNLPSITLTATNADAAQAGFLVEYRPTTDANGDPITYADDATGWETFGQYDISVEAVAITGLQASTSYQIAIRYVSEFGILGARRILATVTTGALVADEARSADTISGKTREQIEAAEAEARRAANEAAEAIIYEVTDRFYKVRANRTEARNLFETERSERIAADLAEATTRTSQISAVENSIAAVETEVQTVATDLAAETSARQTQVSAVEDNVATLTTQYNTLATDVSSQATSLTNLTATVNDQGTDLTALSSDFAIAQANIDTLFAARIIRVSAGAAEASIKLFAENSGGTEASKVNITGNTVTIGPDDQVEFRADGLFTIRGTSGANALRFSPNTRKLEIWNPDGTLQFDSLAGGVQTPGVKAGALTRQWIARDGPSNWYITTTRKKLASFTVNATSAEAALQIDAAVAVFNDHSSDVHAEVVIEVNTGSNGSHAEQTMIGYDVTEAARCGLTTGTLGTGNHTIDVWVKHYGSRAGTVGGTEVRVASYEIRAALVERTAVTTLTNATQSSSGGGSPGGSFTPPPGGGVLP